MDWLLGMLREVEESKGSKCVSFDPGQLMSCSWASASSKSLDYCCKSQIVLFTYSLLMFWNKWHSDVKQPRRSKRIRVCAEKYDTG